jgi:hypothetical protein
MFHMAKAATMAITAFPKVKGIWGSVLKPVFHSAFAPARPCRVSGMPINSGILTRASMPT